MGLHLAALHMNKLNSTLCIEGFALYILSAENTKELLQFNASYFLMKALYSANPPPYS